MALAATSVVTHPDSPDRSSGGVRDCPRSASSPMRAILDPSGMPRRTAGGNLARLGLFREVLDGRRPLARVPGLPYRPRPPRVARVPHRLYQRVLGRGLLAGAEPGHQVEERVPQRRFGEAGHRAVALGYRDGLALGPFLEAPEPPPKPHGAPRPRSARRGRGSFRRPPASRARSRGRPSGRARRAAPSRGTVRPPPTPRGRRRGRAPPRPCRARSGAWCPRRRPPRAGGAGRAGRPSGRPPAYRVPRFQELRPYLGGPPRVGLEAQAFRRRFEVLRLLLVSAPSPARPAGSVPPATACRSAAPDRFPCSRALPSFQDFLHRLEALGELPGLEVLPLLLDGPDDRVEYLVHHRGGAPVHVAPEDVGGQVPKLLFQGGQLPAPAGLRQPAPAGVAPALVFAGGVMGVTMGVARSNYDSTTAAVSLYSLASGHQLPIPPSPLPDEAPVPVAHHRPAGEARGAPHP